LNREAVAYEARAIKKLGDNATAIYLAGGYTGKFFAQLLHNEGIESFVIETAKQARENLIVLVKQLTFNTALECRPIH